MMGKGGPIEAKRRATHPEQTSGNCARRTGSLAGIWRRPEVAKALEVSGADVLWSAEPVADVVAAVVDDRQCALIVAAVESSELRFDQRAPTVDGEPTGP